MYKVVVEDLTHLGGMMGTEYTTVLDTRYFTTEDLAMEFIHKDFNKRTGGKEKLPKYYTKTKSETVWDCRFVGYTLSINIRKIVDNTDV